MTEVYGLMADLHLHSWSAFSTTLESGLNSRLAGLLGEIERCAKEVKAAGGDRVFVAGDIFHVRGSVSPTVLNSTRDAMSTIAEEQGVEFVIIPGNHDLEGRESNRLSSAVTALECDGVRVINHTYQDNMVLLVPWIESIDSLRAEIASLLATQEDGSARKASMYDLILHAPIDGVIKGLPSHGLTPEWLASLGFKRVFSGHYHHHKRFDGGIHSIGALAHHSWSDIGSKAGFLLVYPDRVDWRKSHLPEFIDLSQLVDLDPAEVPLIVDGNYVRVKIEASKVKDVEGARQELLDMGAKAVIVQAQPRPPAREGTATTASAGASLEASISNYIKSIKDIDAGSVMVAAMDVLTAVDSLGD